MKPHLKRPRQKLDHPRIETTKLDDQMLLPHHNKDSLGKCQLHINSVISYNRVDNELDIQDSFGYDF